MRSTLAAWFIPSQCFSLNRSSVNFQCFPNHDYSCQVLSIYQKCCAIVLLSFIFVVMCHNSKDFRHTKNVLQSIWVWFDSIECVLLTMKFYCSSRKRLIDTKTKNEQKISTKNHKNTIENIKTERVYRNTLYGVMVVSSS